MFRLLPGIFDIVPLRIFWRLGMSGVALPFFLASDLRHRQRLAALARESRRPAIAQCAR